MIELHINPSRVEKIVFSGTSELEEDFDYAAWVAIRPLVHQIDRRLRTIVKNVSCERTGSPPAERVHR